MRLFKGWFGEKKTAFIMWLSLDKKVYRRFHDLIIPSMNGTTQIDHLLVSEYGLFIVETKNKKGWIYGSADQPRWMQTLHGKKYPFQNPLRQTFRQKKVLSEYLNMHEANIFTFVYFVGECRFKTPMPSNVINSKLAKTIKQFQTPLLAHDELTRVVNAIESHTIDSTLTTKDHVRSLKERHNSDTNCPRCGSQLSKRVAKSGRNAGSEFLGCSNYPKCRFTKSC